MAADDVVAAEEGDELGLRAGERRLFAVLPGGVVTADGIAKGQELKAGDEGEGGRRS